MSVRAYLFWGFGILVGGWYLTSCNGAKTAISLLEKQKYIQTQEKLEKAAAKDSLPVDVYYVYSLLYTDSLFSDYNIDTAYRYVQQAIAWYPQLTNKRQTKLYQQLQLDTVQLQQQKRYIDSLAYVRANGEPGIQSYQQFIDRFPTAQQYHQAVAHRNRLVFDSIQRIDTYQGYKYFMETYPDAAQYSLAQQRYNTLAFQELTQKGDLRSYLSFLKSYPRSPYRPQAERAIFELGTADNRLEHYADFARAYPRSNSARQAVNTLYHLYKSRYPPNSFLKAFPNLPYADSLRTVTAAESQVLAPLLDGGHYGFMDAQGKHIGEAHYDEVPEHYFCEGVRADFIHTATRADGQLLHQILTKSGMPVFSVAEYTDSTDSYIDEVVSDRGAGLLEVVVGNRRSLWHKGGHVIIDEQENVEEVELLLSDDQAYTTWPIPYQLISYRVGGQWGIKSFSGRTLLAPDYDAIEEYGPFLVLERDGLLAITNRKAVLEQTDVASSLAFSFDDVALLDDQYLVAYQGEQETVLDKQLRAVVPLDSHSVVRRFGRGSLAADHWLVKTANTVQRVVGDSLVAQSQVSYSLYSKGDKNSDSLRWQKAYYNDYWLALQYQDKFFLTNYQESDRTTTAYDSVQILSERFVLAFETPGDGQDSVVVLSNRGVRRSFSFQMKADGRMTPTFRLLRTSETIASDHLREYLVVSSGKAASTILNPSGEIILEQKLTEATAYPQGLLAIQAGRYQGLIDSTGQELLPARYDGIGNYEAPGNLSLLKSKKFGLYQYPSGTLIEPVYESALTVYHIADSAAQSLFVAKANGKYGIVTATNQHVSPFTFDRVVYWNDTSALVKADGQWMIYRLTSETTNGSSLAPEQVLYEGIDDFSFFRTDALPVIPDRDGDRQAPEQLLRIYANNAYGVLSNQRGEILSPTYDGVSLFGDATTNDYLFFTEKYVSEAELYIMIYLNSDGELVKRLALTPDQYDRVYCDGY